MLVRHSREHGEAAIVFTARRHESALVAHDEILDQPVVRVSAARMASGFPSQPRRAALNIGEHEGHRTVR